MNILLSAADHMPTEYLQLAALFPALLAYTIVIRSLDAADGALQASTEQERVLPAMREELVEVTRLIPVVAELLESAGPEDKSDLYRRYDSLTKQRQELLEESLRLKKQHLSSALRSRRWSDLMLILMVLSVAGGIALVVAQMFFVAPIVFGVSPTAYVAYRRLLGATKDASDMAHTERMRDTEYDEKRLEIEERQMELADKRRTRDLDAEKLRIEVMSKRLELEQRIGRDGTDPPSHA